MMVRSYSGETLLYITVDILGAFSIITCTILNYYLEMAGIADGISWYEAWVTSGLFPEVISLYGITMGAWMVADGLKGTPGCIPAAVIATGLWVVFIGINIAYVWGGLQLGFNDEWARNIYIGTLVTLLFLSLGLKPVEEHLTTMGANLVVQLLTRIGRAPTASWNPIISTMTNIYKIITLAIFSGLVMYHQGKIMGWW